MNCETRHSYLSTWCTIMLYHFSTRYFVRVPSLDDVNQLTLAARLPTVDTTYALFANLLAFRVTAHTCLINVSTPDRPHRFRLGLNPAPVQVASQDPSMQRDLRSIAWTTLVRGSPAGPRLFSSSTKLLRELVKLLLSHVAILQAVRAARQRVRPIDRVADENSGKVHAGRGNTTEADFWTTSACYSPPQ